MNLVFFLNSIFLGVGLAMDAFSVSVANALNDPWMKKGKMCLISGIFAFFQFLMPMAGWFCVHNIAKQFTAFGKYIPWIAFALLVIIGGKMLAEGFKKCDNSTGCRSLSLITLLIQGIATSIDALSVGFTIAAYSALRAFVSCLIISAVTFVICMAGIVIGKKAGTVFSGKASILGGVILLLIGAEIFITGIF